MSFCIYRSYCKDKGDAVLLSRFWSGLRYRLGETPWARSLRIALRAPSAHNQVEHNIWNLYVEVFWAAILSAAAAFNATFAVRLGASNELVGRLSSIPALLAVFLLIPSARFLESHTKRAPWIWGSLFVARLGYGLIAVLPWVIPQAHQATALVWLLIAISIPSTFFGTGFNPLLADVVPERDRARVFANRNIIVGVMVAMLTFLAGKWLELASERNLMAFPGNFQVLYVVGFIGSMMSMIYLLKMRVPESKVIPREPHPRGKQLSLLHWRTQAGAFWAGNRSFVRIILNSLVFGFGDWLVGPLYIIFFVRHLNASDAWIGLNSTLANIGVIVGYALWRRWLTKLDYQRALLISIPLSALYPFLVSFFPHLSAILVWGVFINLVNPGVNLSHFNILLNLCPEERRASYIAAYSAIMNAGAFVGPMIGVALLNVLNIRWVLIIGGSIRLAGALLFYVFKVQMPKVEATR
ncbi:MAG: MFS transporter [Anaerolineae bacterium]|nr:MFS transporter [Anaerolineae bacterium]